MLDEIQTGMCRSGSWFAYQRLDNAQPDVMTVAKALGNGVPIGACLARGVAAELFHPGNHGSTFGGNPLVCAAALAVIDTMETEDLCARATAMGQQLLEGFRAKLAEVPGVSEIRGQGMLLAIELDRPCGALVAQALAEGLLINATAERVIRLLPPLVLSEEQAGQLVDTLSRLVTGFLA